MSSKHRPTDTSHPLEKLRGEVENVFDRLSESWQDFESTISDHLPDWLSRFRKPRTDASESEGTIEFSIEVPGLGAEDIEVSVDNGVLTVQGEKVTEREERERNYYLKERSSQNFYRSFSLPGDAESGKISASCRNGLLTIRIPRSEPEKTRAKKIPVDG